MSAYEACLKMKGKASMGYYIIGPDRRFYYIVVTSDELEIRKVSFRNDESK